jgi:hypothetical protein
MDELTGLKDPVDRFAELKLEQFVLFTSISNAFSINGQVYVSFASTSSIREVS